MTHRRKFASRLALAGLMMLPLVTACGMRGGLARPDPIIKERPVPPPVAPAPVAAEPQQSTIVRQRVNEFGGEIPDAAPTEPVASAPLEDPVAPDDDE